MKNNAYFDEMYRIGHEWSLAHRAHEELKEQIIKEKGWTEGYQNGANQRGVKKSSEGETYNVVLKNYNSTLAAICKLLPDERAGGDELMDFIGR